MRKLMNGDTALFAFLGQARGYVFTYLATEATAAGMLWAGKLTGDNFVTMTIGLFAALAAGGGVAAFRTRAPQK